VGNFEANTDLGFTGLVGAKCGGPIEVKFYNDQGGVFADQAPTISYRHHADFSADLNPLCRVVGPMMSEVDVGSCATFPKRFDQDENQWVPFRTLVSLQGGNSAVVNSPSCDNGQVVRKSLRLDRLVLKDQDPSKPKTLEVTILLSTQVGVGTPLNAKLTYTLVPAQNPQFEGAWSHEIDLNHRN